MTLVDELALLLRPAGGGIHLAPSGKAEQQALERRLYGVASEAAVVRRWREDLGRVPSARAVSMR